MLVQLTHPDDVATFVKLNRGGLPLGKAHTVLEVDVEFPADCRPVLPAIDGDASREVTSVRVRLEDYEDGEGFDITANVLGHVLTKAGVRRKDGGHGGALVDTSCPIRWELRRAAILKVLDWHDYRAERANYGKETLVPYAAHKEALRLQYEADEVAWQAKIKAKADALVAASEAQKLVTPVI